MCRNPKFLHRNQFLSMSSKKNLFTHESAASLMRQINAHKIDTMLKYFTKNHAAINCQQKLDEIPWKYAHILHSHHRFLYLSVALKKRSNITTATGNKKMSVHSSIEYQMHNNDCDEILMNIFFNIRQQFPSSLLCHVTALDIRHMYITHQKVIFPIDQTNFFRVAFL